MKFGVCTKLERIDVVKNGGFEYIELKLSDVASMSEEELSNTCKILDKNEMWSKTYNVFCTKDLNLSYAADEHEISAYAKRAFANAQRLGGEIAVVGSGKARNIPAEYSFADGREKFKRVLSLIADIAADHNIKIALEPLNTNETNLINTLSDASKLCEEIDKPNLGFLADLFHMYRSDENVSEILKYKDQIIHAHIAKRDETRGAPGITDRPEDLIKMHDALTKIGYNGILSLEASSKNDFETSVKSFAELADHLKLR